MLSRRLDPRAGVSVVWGTGRGGPAANVIPDARHRSAGTVRMLDAVAWSDMEQRIRDLRRRDRARRTACRRSSTTSAACRRWSTTPASVALLGRAVDAVLGRRGARAHRPEPRRRGLRVVPRPACRGPWAGSAPASPGARRTTSTRATCASTSGPPASRPSCWRPSRSSALGHRPGNNWPPRAQPG